MPSPSAYELRDRERERKTENLFECGRYIHRVERGNNPSEDMR